MQLDEASHLVKHRQGGADVDVASEQLALVVGAVDVDNHVGVHLVVGIQHPAAVPLDQRRVQQRNLLHLSIITGRSISTGAWRGVYTRGRARAGTGGTAWVSTRGTVGVSAGNTVEVHEWKSVCRGSGIGLCMGHAVSL